MPNDKEGLGYLNKSSDLLLVSKCFPGVLVRWWRQHRVTKKLLCRPRQGSSWTLRGRTSYSRRDTRGQPLFGLLDRTHFHQRKYVAQGEKNLHRIFKLEMYLHGILRNATSWSCLVTLSGMNQKEALLNKPRGAWTQTWSESWGQSWQVGKNAAP